MVLHKISVDMQHPQTVLIHCKRGDALTRAVQIRLYSDGSAWAPPDESLILRVAYSKPDGTGGAYEALDDGTTACTLSADRKTVTALLAPQVLSCAGIVDCEVQFIGADGLQISTFSWGIAVQPGASDRASRDYYNLVTLEGLSHTVASMRQIRMIEIALSAMTPDTSGHYTVETDGYISPDFGLSVGDYLLTTDGAILQVLSLQDVGSGSGEAVCSKAGQMDAPGRSAYEIAVDNGYEGTEAQWLASLQGPQGAQGQQGPQGPKGDPGTVQLPLSPQNGEDLAVCGTGVLHVDEDEISLSSGSGQTGQGAAYVGMLGVGLSYIPQGGSTADEIAVTIDGNGIQCGVNQIHGVAAPTAGTDAANKTYVDGRVDNLIDTVNSWLAAIVGGGD